MPSMNRNEIVACLECGRDYTRLDLSSTVTFQDLSRHRKHCDVSKCSNCNFYTHGSEELTNHMKKKQYSCQHKNNLCAQQSQKTIQEEV